MDQKPEIRTALPGPRARSIINRSEQSVSPSLPRAYPLVVERASGMMVQDVDGNRFLDCAAGIAVCSTGHCHPRVVRAVKKQAERLLHICGADYYDPLYIDLAERLSQLLPGATVGRVFLGNSGAEAVEAAFKLARFATGRPHVIAFQGSFHGRTMGALSLTASKSVYRKGFGPFVPAITHVPYAYCYQCPLHLTYPSCALACVDYIEEQVIGKTVPPDEVAAIFVEPVLGEGGYVVPPPHWLARLRDLCDRLDCLLVADEVQCGMGRTGKMLAIENWDVSPDIVCLAKALGSGLPISAMIARNEWMRWPSGAHGSTFGGNPVACAAALETLAVIRDEGLVENAARMGEQIRKRLREIAGTSPLIGDVRGLGLMIGIELVGNDAQQTSAATIGDALALACFERGLLVLTCGPSSIRLSPPLIINQEAVDIALDILVEALLQVEREIG